MIPVLLDQMDKSIFAAEKSSVISEYQIGSSE
jgi:hypothetical protein